MDQMRGDMKPAEMPDFEELSRNVARFVEEAGKATAAYLKPLEQQPAGSTNGGEIVQVVRTLGTVAEKWLVDPQKTLEAQQKLGTQFVQLWASTLFRFQGTPAHPVVSPDPKDSRFSDPQWAEVTIQALVDADTAASDDDKLGYVFLADATAMSDDEHALLAVDFEEEPGRTFRVVPSAFTDASSNLAVGNMDFADFAEATDESGTFRGFDD